MNVSDGRKIAAPAPTVERPAGSSTHGDPAVIPLFKAPNQGNACEAGNTMGDAHSDPRLTPAAEGQRFERDGADGQDVGGVLVEAAPAAERGWAVVSRPTPAPSRTEPVVLAPSEVDYLRDFVRTVSHREPAMSLMCGRALRMLTDEGDR